MQKIEKAVMLRVDNDTLNRLKDYKDIWLLPSIDGVINTLLDNFESGTPIEKSIKKYSHIINTKWYLEKVSKKWNK